MRAVVARGPWPVLLLVSLAGWVAPLGLERWFAVPEFCGASGPWSATLVLHQPAILPWLLMLLAMMPPLLARPMRHLWRRSLRRRRTRAIALFTAVYIAVWLLAGVVLLAAASGLRMVTGAGVVPAIAIALLWQATPAKQACLNRCHGLPPLATFGLPADLDCLRFGAAFGLWCVGACWALMLVPLAVDTAHVALMAVAAAVMFAERLTPPRPARWCVAVPACPVSVRWIGRGG